MKKIKISFFFILTLLFTACNNTSVEDVTQKSLIPIPVSMEAGEGAFDLTAYTQIVTKGENSISTYFKNLIAPATGFDLKNAEGNAAESNYVEFEILKEKQEKLGKEGYELIVDEKGIKLTANEAEGLFRGVQTIRQLLPADIEKTAKQAVKWTIPACHIKDYPNYEHRGAMLDVSRHFFGVPDVKRFIDLIAAYKMNVLHLHLADDQGWRIEIKSWPNLTKHGGKTAVGGGKGGFYTQEDYTEIVNYAKERYITIIPEIDMPGHTNAALSSYPELNCDGKAPELYTGIEVGFSSLCVRKPITYEFIDSVIREVAALTPGNYIHIGGDESHATKKEDYIYFIEKTQAIVNKYGKQMIGWDEIVTSNLTKNSVAQHWATEKNAKSAVKQGLKIIMSPAKRAYLDMQYDSTSRIGLHWAAYVEVDSGYLWSPDTFVDSVPKANILGIEAPLWTETVENMDDIEYLVFPRLVGHAEIGWSPKDLRDWTTYKTRLGNHKDRFDALGINFYRSKLVDWK